MEKQIIVDGRGHLVGRLASIVAKQLLNGEKIVVVRCEELNMSGSLFRNKLKFEVFLQKRSNTNPRRGAVKERSPSRVFFRAVRGMIPHKTVRGAEALARLTVTEGIPHPFDKKKRLVVPAALRNLRLRPGRRFCKLGDLSAAFGWKYQPLIAKLEAARKVRSSAHYKRAKAIINLRKKAIAAVDAKIPDDVAKLAQLGYLSSA